MTPTLNAAWHARHKMPRNPTTEQRLTWHVQHAKHCACRSIPPKLQALLRRSARVKSGGRGR